MQNMIPGAKYNWRGQPERLIYLGPQVMQGRVWYQFALVSEPDRVWCEVPVQDLACFELTPTTGAAA